MQNRFNFDQRRSNININVNQDLREKSTQVYRVKNPNETVTLLGTQRDRTRSEASD